MYLLFVFLGGRKEGQTDCIERDSFCISALALLSEFMSLLEGERARTNDDSQKQMNGVKSGGHEALCLRLGHSHINAIQMICYKKVYLHRYDKLKLKKEKVNIAKRNQTDLSFFFFFNKLISFAQCQ